MVSPALFSQRSYFWDILVVELKEGGGPYLLALKGARVYDLDRTPVSACAWTEAAEVAAFYEFFKAHGAEFQHSGGQ